MQIDHTRTHAAKARALSIRNARRHKAAALFLAFAFEPLGDTFGTSAANRGRK